jgi:uncharacterized membrane protein YhaH (DUF805 family)
MTQMNQKQFWITVVLCLALKFGGVIALELLPDLYNLLRYLDNAAFIVLLLAVAARFKDIGWPRWWGVGFLIFVMAVLPVVLLFTVVKPPLGLPPAGVIDSLAQWGWVSTVLLLVFLVFVGTRSSRFAAPGESDPKRRQEPTLG